MRICYVSQRGFVVTHTGLPIGQGHFLAHLFTSISECQSTRPRIGQTTAERLQPCRIKTIQQVRPRKNVACYIEFSNHRVCTQPPRKLDNGGRTKPPTPYPWGPAHDARHLPHAFPLERVSLGAADRGRATIPVGVAPKPCANVSWCGWLGSTMRLTT